MAQAMIADVTVNTLNEMVVQNSARLPVLMLFWSPLNAASTENVATWEKVAHSLAGQFILAKVQYDQQHDIVERFQVPEAPFYQLVINGEIMAKQAGIITQAEAHNLIQQHLTLDASDTLRNQAGEAFRNDQFEEAVALLRQAAEANANNFHVHLDLVQMYLASGHHDKAVALFAKLPEPAQQDPRGKELDGLLFFSDVAANASDIQSLQATLAEHPNDSHALYQLAAFLMLHGKAEQALQALLKLFLHDSDYGQGLPRQAILKAFTMLSEKAPDLVTTYRRRWQSYMN